MGTALGLPNVSTLIDAIVQQVPAALATMAARLPERFPAAIFDAISDGMTKAAERLGVEPDKRGNAV
jgi:hypothetical protein